jgi:hypothetical protein
MSWLMIVECGGSGEETVLKMDWVDGFNRKDREGRKEHK